MDQSLKVNKKLIENLFKNLKTDVMNLGNMKKIIYNLRKEEVLQKEYSHSGWMVFHSKTIHDIIKIQLNHELQKAK